MVFCYGQSYVVFAVIVAFLVGLTIGVAWGLLTGFDIGKKMRGDNYLGR